MLNWLRRRRLSAEGKKKLMILSARAEEALVETHVVNLLELLEVLGDEIDLDRGLEIYMEMMRLEEPLASSVTNRLLARLENPGRAGRQPQRFRNAFRE
jgi:hypothetical protein